MDFHLILELGVVGKKSIYVKIGVWSIFAFGVNQVLLVVDRRRGLFVLLFFLVRVRRVVWLLLRLLDLLMIIYILN
jgi:hypothetical protein